MTTLEPLAAVSGEAYSRSVVWVQVWGAIQWGIVYATTIGITAAVGASGTEIGYSAIPLAGPWICVAACANPDPYLPGLAVSGVLQAASLLMIVIGTAVRVEHRMTNGQTPNQMRSWTLLPLLGPSVGGAALVGTF